MKLFPIADEIEMAMAEGFTPDGHLTEAGRQAFAALDLRTDEAKLDLACAIKGERAEAAAVKVVAAQLAARAAGHEKRANAMEGLLYPTVPQGTQLRDDRVEIKWTTSQGVDIDNEEALPIEYIDLKEVPSKKRIREALKQGKDVPGAGLYSRKNIKVV